MRNITAVVNQTLNMTFTAKCNPQCKYTWKKDGKEISTGSWIQLEKITPQDEGTYICTASNDIGNSQEKKIVLSVIGK